MKIINLFLLSAFIIGCSGPIPLLGDKKLPPKKDFSIREKTTFLPNSYVETIDSTDQNKDYIDTKLDIMLPDTLPDTTLYNSEDPVFRPIPLDSGILLSNRDMALYIKDRENAKYLMTALESRRKLQLEIIKGAVEAEGMYQETLEASNQYNKEVFNAMKEERNEKRIWRNIFFISLVFGAGYVANEVVK